MLQALSNLFKKYNLIEHFLNISGSWSPEYSLQLLGLLVIIIISDLRSYSLQSLLQDNMG